MDPSESDDITSEYIVAWFPPEGDREKKFGDHEGKARRFAAQDEVAEWNPLLLHRLTFVVEEVLPLAAPEEN